MGSIFYMMKGYWSYNKTENQKNWDYLIIHVVSHYLSMRSCLNKS